MPYVRSRSGADRQPIYAYTVGACRCDPCREAINGYRADRRTHGLDRPTYRLPARQGTEPRHVSRDWFRNRVWQPAVTAADLPSPVTIRDLRHAAASWSLAGGADLQQVSEMLGHTSLRAVERYLHTLPGTTNRNALEANHRTRQAWAQRA